jgi:hypothetical protein
LKEIAVTTKASKARALSSNRSGTDAAESFLTALEHPFKPEILALRQIILAADASITEEIKWNAPSFRTSEHFATFQLRAKDGVQIILHRGAKPREPSAEGLEVADPDSLLEWLGKDRASVTFRNLDEVERRRPAFAQLIRHWIAHV